MRKRESGRFVRQCFAKRPCFHGSNLISQKGFVFLKGAAHFAQIEAFRANRARIVSRESAVLAPGNAATGSRNSAAWVHHSFSQQVSHMHEHTHTLDCLAI